MNKHTHNLSLIRLDTEARKELWQYYQKQHRHNRKKNLIPNLKRNLVHGWLLPYLGQIDSLLWGRWNYWARCQTIPKHAWYRWQFEPAFALIEGRSPEYLPKFVIEETLPDEPIPQIEWHYSSDAEAMLQDTLNCIPEHGEWQGWSSWTYLEYFLDWSLFGFGHPAYRQLPKEPQGCQGASMRLYQMLDLSFLLFYPEDYLGRILPEICSKKAQRNQGFYPTPLVVSTFMAEILNNPESNTKEERVKTFYEPTVGTGSLMLTQSNYTLCGIGQDIDSILLKCALFQFYLFAPWFACPIWWLGHTDLLQGNSLSLEKPTSMNAIYWYQELFDNSPSTQAETLSNADSQNNLSDTIEKLKHEHYTSVTDLPPETAVQEVLNGKRKRKKATQSPYQQLSLFDF